MKKAIIFGASGLVGSFLLDKLLNDSSYYEVEVYGRSRLNKSHNKLKEKLIPFENLKEEVSHIKADVVFCCLGTTLKKAGSKEKQIEIDHNYPIEILDICKNNRVARFVFISSIGANSKSNNFYLSMKGKVDDKIQEEYSSNSIIVRPSLLKGPRKEFRFGEKLGTLLDFIFSPLYFGKFKKYKGIKAERVAESMIRLVKNEESGVFESDQL